MPKTKKPPINFDPNMVLCGRQVVQTVRLTFAQWQYRAVREVQIGGNCRGLDVIDAAVEQAANDLLEEFEQREETDTNEWTHPYLILESDEEDLTHELEEDAADDLKQLLVAAEIIEFKEQA